MFVHIKENYRVGEYFNLFPCDTLKVANTTENSVLNIPQWMTEVDSYSLAKNTLLNETFTQHIFGTKWPTKFYNIVLTVILQRILEMR